MTRTRAPKGRHLRRTSIQLEDGLHATLDRMAQRRDVSLAYVVREALNEYVERRTVPAPEAREAVPA